MKLRFAIVLFLLIIIEGIDSQTSTTASPTMMTASTTESTTTMTASTQTQSTTTATASATISSISRISSTLGITGTATHSTSGNSSTIATSGSTSSNTFDNTYPSCSIVNNTIVDGNFQLIITPSILSSNSVYTVKINGSGNATVVLQAVSGENFVGTWSSGNHTCTGDSPLFEIVFERSNTVLVANWTSTNSLQDVEIRAFIRVSDTHKLTNMLSPAPTTAPTTTVNSGSVGHVVSTYMNLSVALIFLLAATKLLL